MNCSVCSSCSYARTSKRLSEVQKYVTSGRRRQQWQKNEHSHDACIESITLVGTSSQRRSSAVVFFSGAMTQFTRKQLLRIVSVRGSTTPPTAAAVLFLAIPQAGSARFPFPVTIPSRFSSVMSCACIPGMAIVLCNAAWCEWIINSPAIRCVFVCTH